MTFDGRLPNVKACSWVMLSLLSKSDKKGFA